MSERGVNHHLSTAAADTWYEMFGVMCSVNYSVTFPPRPDSDLFRCIIGNLSHGVSSYYSFVFSNCFLVLFSLCFLFSLSSQGSFPVSS